MKGLHSGAEAIPRLRCYAWALAGGWTLVVVLLLAWGLWHQRRSFLEAAFAEARMAYEKDLLYRRWNSMHGGVYVEACEKTRPNPHLRVPERDVVTPSGRTLTLIHPARMARQVYELAEREGLASGHITSLNPVNPDNAPDAWERRALQALAEGHSEVADLVTMDGRPYIRLMKPFRIEPSCLPCHGAQGVKAGDMYGGLSVAVPLQSLWAAHRSEAAALVLGYAVVWALGLCGIALGAQRVQRLWCRATEASDAVQEQEGYFRTVVSASLDAMIAIDETGRVTLFNQAAERMFGWSAQEMLGQPLDRLMPESYRAAHARYLDAYFHGRPNRAIGRLVELPALRRDGREFRIELSLVASEYRGKRIVLAVIRDITERKQTEEKLKRYFDELEQFGGAGAAL